MKKIRGKKVAVLFLLVLLGFSTVAGLFKIPVISIPEVHAAEGNSSLVGNLETIVDSVNYTEDIDAIYQGMIVGETSMQQLINAYNALTFPMTVLEWTPILSKLGYVNQTTIEWALDNQQMMSNGLPYTYWDGSKEAFDVNDRYMILAYGYAIQYKYDLAKWNLTQSYNSFKAAVVASGFPALLYVDQDGVPYRISYGPRFYDECGETIDCFLDFYNLGITAALNDSLTTWLWVNDNLWSGTYYNYALSWGGYECEAGGFLQIALKLWDDNSSLLDTQNLLVDIENRFLQEQFSSPQWLNGTIVHMTSYNLQLRLENTVMAWAAILGSYGEFNSTYRNDVQEMLTGVSPAWLELLQSPLCGSNFPYFLMHSDDPGPSDDATATGADLMFILGIVPQTATIAVPIEENSYEDIYSILDPQLFNINLTTNVATVALAKAGTLNFQFNQTVTGSFSTPGVYTVQFSPDWNTIVNVTFVSNLPSNRQYMYTNIGITPLSYCITSSADSNSTLSPSDNVVVNANFSQTFTYSANNGYNISSVVVDGSSVPITGSYAFNDVQANHTISVASTQNVVSSYAINDAPPEHTVPAELAIKTVNITASAEANGAINPSGSVYVNYGRNQSFTITATADYHVFDVIVDNVSQGAVSSYAFTDVQADHMITVNFAIDTFNITAFAGAHGFISPSKSVSVNYGGNQTFNINPNTGYYIVDVIVNGSSVGAVSSYTFNNVQTAYSISAKFALSPAIYEIAVAIVIAAILAVVLALRKSKKRKTQDKQEN